MNELLVIVISWDGLSGCMWIYGEFFDRICVVVVGLYEWGYVLGDLIVIFFLMMVDVVVVYFGIFYVGCIVVLIVDSFVVLEIVKWLCLLEVKGMVIYDVMMRGNKKIGLFLWFCEVSDFFVIVIFELVEF